MKFLRFLGSELVLGTMVAILSILTAWGSWQGSVADGKQSEHELLGMKSLSDGNAEYLRANQDITQDYNYFDNWYLNVDERPDVAEYYQGSFSPALQAAMERDPETVWDEQYYDDIYADAVGYFEESDLNFETASQWNDRGDMLQVFMLATALGLAFAAWASLLKEESKMRVLFALFGALTLVAGLVIYLVFVPKVV